MAENLPAGSSSHAPQWWWPKPQTWEPIVADPSCYPGTKRKDVELNGPLCRNWQNWHKKWLNPQKLAPHRGWGKRFLPQVALFSLAIQLQVASHVWATFLWTCLPSHERKPCTFPVGKRYIGNTPTENSSAALWRFASWVASMAASLK